MSALFDRSAFKATEMATLKEQAQDIKDKGYSGPPRAKFIKLNPGANKVRIFPKHPGTASFQHPKKTVWMKFEKERDGQVELKNWPIFNAKVHGDLSQDVVELYTDFVYQELKGRGAGKPEREVFQNALRARNVGINYSTKWCVYAKVYRASGNEFGILELPASVKNAMETIASNSASVSDVMTPDPFSHPDKGRNVIINFDKTNKDPRMMYTATGDFTEPEPLTDQELKTLSELPSLEDKFKNKFSRIDFKNQLTGLMAFDAYMESEARKANYAAIKPFNSDVFADSVEALEKEILEKIPDTAIAGAFTSAAQQAPPAAPVAAAEQEVDNTAPTTVVEEVREVVKESVDTSDVDDFLNGF